MTPELRAALVELRDALSAMVAIMVRGDWKYTTGWENDIATIGDYLDRGAPPKDIANTAKNIVSGFGVGMGSLSDTYISDDFDASRDAVQAKASAVFRLVTVV